MVHRNPVLASRSGTLAANTIQGRAFGTPGDSIFSLTEDHRLTHVSIRLNPDQTGVLVNFFIQQGDDDIHVNIPQIGEFIAGGSEVTVPDIFAWGGSIGYKDNSLISFVINNLSGGEIEWFVQWVTEP